jgi:hypothetical protein
MRSSGTKEKDEYGVYGMVVLFVNVIIIAAGRQRVASSVDRTSVNPPPPGLLACAGKVPFLALKPWLTFHVVRRRGE